MTHIIHQLLKKYNETNKKDDKNIDTTLTSEEQETVSYVAGYLVFSLLKKYQKLRKVNKHCVEADTVITFLNSLRCAHEKHFQCYTFLEFTRKWIDLINRGGLVKVNDDMFIFVRCVENCVRQTRNIKLIKKYQGEDLRDIIQKELQNSPFISYGWDSLSRLIPNRQLAEVLRNQLIVKWIDIRARSFVDSYVQRVKRTLAKRKADGAASKVALSKKGEQSMRKTLT